MPSSSPSTSSMLENNTAKVFPLSSRKRNRAPPAIRTDTGKSTATATGIETDNRSATVTAIATGPSATTSGTTTATQQYMNDCAGRTNGRVFFMIQVSNRPLLLQYHDVWVAAVTYTAAPVVTIFIIVVSNRPLLLQHPNLVVVVVAATATKESTSLTIGNDTLASISIAPLFRSTDCGISCAISTKRVFQKGGDVPKNVCTLPTPFR
jgi:hypothetical protein